MKESKTKSSRNMLSQQFKDKCKEVIKQQPRNYLVSALKDNQLSLDLSLFAQEDLPFFHLMLTLPLHKIIVSTPDPTHQRSPSKSKGKDSQVQHVKAFQETPKFKEFVHYISQAMEKSSCLRVVKIQRVQLSIRAIKQLNEGILKTNCLRELALVNCGITEDHLEQIKQSLAQNKSLITLDLSYNKLKEAGGMIGNIMAEHSQRRNEIVYFLQIRGEVPADDLSNTGLCEVNLEHNLFNDKSATELAAFLKSDSWTKCINLRNNQIKLQGVKELALMLKNNSSLISLDLRGNDGLSKQYSRYIYKKLVLNMQKYKQQKQCFQKCKEQPKLLESQVATPAKFDKNQSKEESPSKYKSVKDNFFTRYDSKEYTTIAGEPKTTEKNNMTLDRKIRIIHPQSRAGEKPCPTCKSKTIEMLRLQKKNLDLQMQLRKVKHALLTKNIDISAIMPISSSNNQNNILELLSTKSNQNDDELLLRMEQIWMELTRVMETIEEHQNTNVHMTNPLDNPNSFSNTIQLYQKNSHLQDLSKQIEQDRLQSMLGASIEHKIDESEEN